MLRAFGVETARRDLRKTNNLLGNLPLYRPVPSAWSFSNSKIHQNNIFERETLKICTK